MKEVRESSIGIVDGKKLYATTPEIQGFTSLDSAIAYFRYNNRWGNPASPIDRDSFEGIKLAVLKELSEGLDWARKRFGIEAEMPRAIKRTALGKGILGDYDDATQEVRFRKGLAIEYAFSTAVHEMVHHADNLMGHPSVEIVALVNGRLRKEYAQSELNKMKSEIALAKWRDPHEIVAYSLDKYCVGKGNRFAKETAQEFLRRCKK